MVAAGVRLTAIFAPEHGFRGVVEAGAKVGDGRDETTGVPVISLYGESRAPTPSMLADLDVLVFDIQDIGARFYTYISTMGLAMQAAARAGKTFLVLDRPNPLGGQYVAGFTLERALTSFVGQYPIPIVHGLTVAELASMIKGERWLDGMARLDLQAMACKGLTRTMRWPATGLPWVATSPNIPTFEAALVYPGIGLVGETLMNEGRGTPTPFLQFGAPWVDGARLAAGLAEAALTGVRFEAVRYVPRAMAGVAATPRFRDEAVRGVRIVVTDVDAYRPLEVGLHALALLQAQARAGGVRLLAGTRMFDAIAGTRRLARMIEQGADGAALSRAWQADVARFDQQRRRYLIY
jgi:uncharacterized protein YbbC (DUF1343 family)